jgi:hypothetical protein
MPAAGPVPLPGPPLLSDEQVSSYMENGFLVAEGLLSELELETLRLEQAEICARRRGEVRGLRRALVCASRASLASIFLLASLPS